MFAVPFKANADRRHHIPKQQDRVTNWPEYDAALRQRGSLWAPNLHATTSAPATTVVHVPVVLRRIGRIWSSGLARGPLGAAGERQHHKERGKPSLPLHHFLLSV
jgi:hypothetical protein